MVYLEGLGRVNGNRYTILSSGRHQRLFHLKDTGPGQLDLKSVGHCDSNASGIGLGGEFQGVLGLRTAR